MESDYNIPENFINRELSWLEFNRRVLECAQDSETPLLERLKFISIFSSNLDEFFMVRVASLWNQIVAGHTKPDPTAGLTPSRQLEMIAAKTHSMVQNQYECYRHLIIKLREIGLTILSKDNLNEQQLKFIEEYYMREVYPVLTPMVVDKSRPFPLILNRTLNIALLLEKTDDPENPVFATVQVPSVLERIVELPSKGDGRNFILLEDIIKLNLDSLFFGNKILGYASYRITRDADLSWDEDEAEDLLEAIEHSLRERKRGDAVRLEIISGRDKRLLQYLQEELDISESEVYQITGPIDLTFLMKLLGLEGYESLRYPPLPPQTPPAFIREPDIFQAIAQEDILVHHPYHSFDPVVQLVKTAAEDPRVLAIKLTIYRVSGNSPIVEALAQAAENGKQVTVLLELKARFDEENNINWAKTLEKAGCHVTYGLVGLKTHCKVLLIVRREPDGIKRYVHMGTGNYNDVTAKIYTDLGLFTANPYFGADASALFNMLSGLSHPDNLYKMTIAPIALRKKFLDLIKRETNFARQGKKARIIIKVNSLVDKEIIEALYEASSAGVKSDLIVRGICSLRPGLPEVSSNINVRSIVGRFLEHSRIYYFFNDGEEEVYASSADLMYRNLNRRVELLFPIENKRNKEKIKEILRISLQDNLRARILNSDGSYSKIPTESTLAIDSQEVLYNLAVEESKIK